MSARRSFGDLLAEIEHRDPVGDRHDELHHVLDQDDGELPLAREIDQQRIERSEFRGCAGRRPARRAAAGAARRRARARDRASSAGRNRARPPGCRGRAADRLVEQRVGVATACASVRLRRARRTERQVGRHARLIPTSTFSSTVMRWSSSIFWKVRAMPTAMRSCGGSGSTGRPVEHDAAARGRQKRETQLNTVDLPAPFGPISAWIEPSRHVHREIVDGAKAAEAHRQVLDREDRAHGAGCRTPAVDATAVSGFVEGLGACQQRFGKAPDAARHEHDGEDEDQAVDEFLPDQEPARRRAHHLGQQPEQRDADQRRRGSSRARRPRSWSAPGSAGQADGVGGHERLVERVHAAGNAGVDRGDHEGHDLGALTSMPEAAATCSLSRIAHIARPNFERVRYIGRQQHQRQDRSPSPGTRAGRCRRRSRG